MSRLQAAWYGVLFPIGPGDISLPQNDQTCSGATEPTIKLAPDFPSPGAKRWGREFNHSTSSNAGVKNKWRYTYPSHIWLHGVKREHFV